ncbi:hypothetical protein BH23GEM8_BH23GEM8_01330 [soil metagenome]
MNLKGRVVLVTGASRGVGAALAEELGREGASVCVNYLRSGEQAEEVVRSVEAAGGQALAHRADVADPAAVEAMVEATIARFGKLDAVVNNALPSYSFDPSAAYTRIETVEWSDFQRQFDGAVRGAFNTTRAALSHMRERQYGTASGSTWSREDFSRSRTPAGSRPRRSFRWCPMPRRCAVW